MAKARILWTIGGESDIELPERFNSESDWREVVQWISENQDEALDPSELTWNLNGFLDLIRWEFDGVEG